MSKQKRKWKQEPNWRPISDMPLIAFSLNGMIEADKEQCKGLLLAKDKPHVLDDYTINRVLKAFNEQVEFIDLYDEQLLRWRKEALTEKQEKEIDKLSEQVNKLKELNGKVLALVNELKKGTINKIMGMDDAELALKVLTGDIPFPK